MTPKIHRRKHPKLCARALTCKVLQTVRIEVVMTTSSLARSSINRIVDNYLLLLLCYVTTHSSNN